MIVRDKMTWFQMIFSYSGTALKRTWGRLTCAVVSSVILTVVSLYYDIDDHGITSAPFVIIGLALGIFHGFRNGAAYDRFWEGRKLWGALVNTSRSLARQADSVMHSTPENQTEVAAFRERFVRRVIAFVHAMRIHLRDQECIDEYSKFLPPEDFAALKNSKNRPVAIIEQLGRDLGYAEQSGIVTAMGMLAIEKQLAELCNILGGCERIKKTPIPFPYTVLIHRLTAFYCFLLPLGIIETAQELTPVVTILVSQAFFGLDEIGDEIENPFDFDPNSLPLAALCRTIEINLLESLGEENLPEPLQPVNNVLN